MLEILLILILGYPFYLRYIKGEIRQIELWAILFFAVAYGPFFAVMMYLFSSKKRDKGILNNRDVDSIGQS